MIKKIDALIASDETLVKDSRMHEIVFVKPIVCVLTALLVGMFFHPYVGAAIVLVSLYPIYTSIVSYITTHLVMTDQKVMVRQGYLSRDWVQIPLERVETAYLVEPIFGRMFGYSTVIITGIGSGTVAVPYVIDGDAFVTDLQGRITHENRTVELNIEGEKFERVQPAT